MEYQLPQPAERRPAAHTLAELRFSCDMVLGSADFGPILGDRLAQLMPPDHPMRSELIPIQDLAVAVLDPIRDPDRYGGELEHVEARWQQLGAWLAELGLPADSGHHLVRAVARAARDVSGEDWDSASSSSWSALQLWMQAHLDAGARSAAAGEHPVPPPHDAPRHEGEQEPQHDRQHEEQREHRGQQAEAPQARQVHGESLERRQEARPPVDPPRQLRPGDASQPLQPVAGPRATRPAPAGHRSGAEQLAAIWSDASGMAAMSLGGAPASALRAVRQIVGGDAEQDQEAGSDPR